MILLETGRFFTKIQIMKKNHEYLTLLDEFLKIITKAERENHKMKKSQEAKAKNFFRTEFKSSNFKSVQDSR